MDANLVRAPRLERNVEKTPGSDLFDQLEVCDRLAVGIAPHCDVLGIAAVASKWRVDRSRRRLGLPVDQRRVAPRDLARLQGRLEFAQDFVAARDDKQS